MKTWEQRFVNLSFLACGGAATISLMALLGMVGDRIELRQWFGAGPPMRFNTALALFFASLSLALRMLHEKPKGGALCDRLGLALGWIPFILGLATLLQYSLHIQIGLDQLFYVEKDFPKAFPGRPSPDTAFNLTLVGFVSLIMNRKDPRFQTIVQWTSLLILALPLTTLISSLFGADPFYSILPPQENATGAPTNTSVAFLLLAFACFFQRPSHGPAALFAQDTMGGIIARRHLSALVLVPFIVTIITELERFLSSPDRSVTLAISILLVLAGLVGFNWFTAKELDRLDKQKQIKEQKLKEQEQLLVGVLDAIPLGIWITDRNGRIIRSNPAGRDIWRGERYVGIEDYDQYKGWWAHNGEPIGANDWSLTRAIVKGETSVDETIIIECFDGSRKVILNSAMPLRDETGQVIGSIATNYDISRRYRMEKNLALVAHAGEELISIKDLELTLPRVAKLLTRELCDCSLIYMVDENGTPKLVSQAYRDTQFAKRFQALVEKIPFHPGSKLGVGDLEQRRSILIRDVTDDFVLSIAQDPQHAIELREILHSYMLVPMVAENKPIGILSLVNSDPTRRFDDIDLLFAEELGRLAALAIENARYSEKLKKAIQAREDVVAIVSHDLRNPLAVILQSCELLNRELKRLMVPDNVTRLANLARSATGRMQELISDLLDLSHLESGQLILNYSTVDSRAFLQETVDLLQPIAAKKHISLSWHVAAGLPPAYADQIRLAQILNNLISNAIKYTPTEGSIDINIRLREDGWLEFVVSDTGCGIKKEHLPLLFERYWKPHESSSGFGLGLYIVKGMIEAHGGSIHVTSEENKGTSFSFTIPSNLVMQPHKAHPTAKTFIHYA